jgi:hypothetical protein
MSTLSTMEKIVSQHQQKSGSSCFLKNNMRKVIQILKQTISAHRARLRCVEDYLRLQIQYMENILILLFNILQLQKMTDYSI